MMQTLASSLPWRKPPSWGPPPELDSGTQRTGAGVASPGSRCAVDTPGCQGAGEGAPSPGPGAPGRLVQEPIRERGSE